MKINKILVPIDFSPCSRNALHYAIDLALKTNAKLHLLHSYYMPVPSVELPVAVDHYQDDQEQMILDSWAELAVKVPQLANVNYSHETQLGFLSEAIVRLAEVQDFDLIVMGTKGSSNKLDRILGSNAYNVAKTAPIPVLVVPEGRTFNGFPSMALAADFHKLNNLEALSLFRSMAEDFGSDIHLLHVSPKAQNLDIEEAQEALSLNNYLKGLKHHFEFMTEENVAEGIERYVIDNDIDLAVLIPRHHSMFEKLFKKQVTRKSILNAHMTTLVLHDD